MRARCGVDGARIEGVNGGCVHRVGGCEDLSGGHFYLYIFLLVFRVGVGRLL